MVAPTLVARDGLIYDPQQLIFTSGFSGETFSVDRYEFENFGYTRRNKSEVLPSVDNTVHAGVTIRQHGDVVIKQVFQFDFILTPERWAILLRIIEYQRQAYAKNNGRDTIETSVILKDNRIASYEGLNPLFRRPEEPVTPLTYDPVDEINYPGWYWATHRILFTDWFTETYGQNKIRVTITAEEALVPSDPTGVAVIEQGLNTSLPILYALNYNKYTDTIVDGALAGWPTFDVVYPYSDAFGEFQLTLLYYTDSTNRSTGYCELIIHQLSNSDFALRYEIPGMNSTNRFVGPERVFFTKKNENEAYLYVSRIAITDELYSLTGMSSGQVVFASLGSASTTGENPYTYGFFDNLDDYYLLESTTFTPIGTVNRRSFRYDGSITDPLSSSTVADVYFFYDDFRDILIRQVIASTVDNLEEVAITGQANTAGDNVYVRAGTARPPGGATYSSTVTGGQVRFAVNPTTGDLFSSYSSIRFQVEDGGSTYSDLITSDIVSAGPSQSGPYIKHQNEQYIFSNNRVIISANFRPAWGFGFINPIEVGFRIDDATVANEITDLRQPPSITPPFALYGCYDELNGTQYLYGVETANRQNVWIWRISPFGSFA